MKNYFFILIFFNIILEGAQRENTVCAVLKKENIVVTPELRNLENYIRFIDDQYITERTRGYFFTKPFCFPMPFIRKCCLKTMDPSDVLYYCKTQLDQLREFDTILSDQYNDERNADVQSACNQITLKYY